MMSEMVDDRLQHCVPFIIHRLETHRRRYAEAENAPPFFLGLNGVQGVGKTVLVSVIQKTLENPPHNLPTVAVSLDDFYLTHAAQLQLASQHQDNPLLQHRGQPSTHDIQLANSVFSSLRQKQPVAIPKYDKAAFNGQGDRLPRDRWEKVNLDGEKIIQVVILEGWSVGFRPLSNESLCQKWKTAAAAAAGSSPAGDITGHHYVGKLGHMTLESVSAINSALKEYDQITNQLDALIHLDALNAQYVYRWRQEQEQALRASNGGVGMTDEQVRTFVDRYYPSYELYINALRTGVLAVNKQEEREEKTGKEKEEEQGCQLRLIIGEDRRVKGAFTI